VAEADVLRLLCLSQRYKDGEDSCLWSRCVVEEQNVSILWPSAPPKCR